MSHLTKMDNRRIKVISEGNFHSIHASNQAEKFKLIKLEQGIESCRHAQLKRYIREERDLMKSLAQFNKDKSKRLSEDEQYFLRYTPGDGITMLSYCDLQSQGGRSRDGDSEGNQNDVMKFEFKSSEPLEKIDRDSQKEEEEERETYHFGDDQKQSIAEIREEMRRFSLEDGTHDEGGRRKRSTRDLGINVSKQFSRPAVATESNQMVASEKRRSSLGDGVVPFYLKRKYDHHQISPKIFGGAQRMLHRRNAITLEDEVYLFRRQLMAPSADLGTISFKSEGVDRSWLNADIRKEREEAIKRQSESNMDFQPKHRPGSGMGRINMALERMPSENCLEPAGTTVSKKTSPKNLETADSIESATRKHSLGIPRKSSLTDKKPYLSRRRHTVGEVISPVTSTRKSSLANLHSFKSLRDVNTAACNASNAMFDDKDVVFPAYMKDRSHTLREFISLRKCRYLRLSKLNWESLIWQSKHQELIDY